MVGGKIAEMSTFCPKAIVGRSIVALPEATLSRCISLTMQRALPGENLEKFRAPQRAEAEELRERCEQWAHEFRKRRVTVAPVLPETLSARQQDISEPLLAIGDNCGGTWPLVVRESLAGLFTERHIPTPENDLLRGIQQFTRERKEDHFLSQEFCAWANEQDETPWSDRPLTPAKLAEMLRIYDIFPTQINRVIKGRQRNSRGYFAAHFQEVFARYLDDPPKGARVL
jgi:hypothetical protein